MRAFEPGDLVMPHYDKLYVMIDLPVEDGLPISYVMLRSTDVMLVVDCVQEYADLQHPVHNRLKAVNASLLTKV